MADAPVVLLKTLPMNEARAFSFNGIDVVLCRTASGVCALDGICTHEDLPLDGGEVSGGVLTCPWHGARYDIHTGQVLALPAVRALRTYPTRVSADGQVHVDVG